MEPEAQEGRQKLTVQGGKDRDSGLGSRAGTLGVEEARGTHGKPGLWGVRGPGGRLEATGQRQERAVALGLCSFWGGVPRECAGAWASATGLSQDPRPPASSPGRWKGDRPSKAQEQGQPGTGGVLSAAPGPR